MIGSQTNLGKKHLRLAAAAEKVVGKEYGVTIAPFPESRLSKVDGVFLNGDGQAVGIFETKSRVGDLKFEGQDPMFTFRDKDYDSMLITAAKIDAMAEISKLLQVASFLIVTYSNEYIGVFQITDYKGTIQIEGIDRKVVKTRATVVGGVANRENCFIPLSAGNFFEK